MDKNVKDIPLAGFKRVPTATILDSCLQLKAFCQKGIKLQTKNTNKFSTPKLTCHHICVSQIF